MSSAMYKPKYGFYNMLSKNFIWGGIGIILGILVNNSVVFITTLFNIQFLLLQIITHLLLCSFVLALINTLFNFFGWSWQNITPGLFFVSFFFGIQFKLFTKIQTNYIL